MSELIRIERENLPVKHEGPADKRQVSHKLPEDPVYGKRKHVTLRLGADQVQMTSRVAGEMQRHIDELTGQLGAGHEGKENLRFRFKMLPSGGVESIGLFSGDEALVARQTPDAKRAANAIATLATLSKVKTLNERIAPWPNFSGGKPEKKDPLDSPRSVRADTSGLEKEVASLREEVRDLGRRLKSSEVGGGLTELLDENERLYGQIRSLKDENIGFTELVGEKQSTIDALSKEVEGLRAAKGELLETSAKLKELAVQLKGKEAELASLRGRVEELTKGNTASCAALEKLQAQIGEVKEAKAALEAEKLAHEETKADSAAVKKKLEEQLAGLEGQFKQLTEKNAASTRTLDKLEAAKAKLEKQNATLAKEVAGVKKLAQQLREKDAKIATQSDEIGKLKGTVGALSEKNRAIPELEKKLKVSEARLQEASGHLKELRAEVVELRKVREKLKDTEAQRRELTELAAKEQKSHSATLGTKRELEDKLAAKEKELEELTAVAEKLKGERNEARQNAFGWKRVKEALDEKNEALRAKIKELSSVQDDSAKLWELEQELEAMRKELAVAVRVKEEAIDREDGFEKAIQKNEATIREMSRALKELRARPTEFLSGSSAEMPKSNKGMEDLARWNKDLLERHDKQEDQIEALGKDKFRLEARGQKAEARVAELENEIAAWFQEVQDYQAREKELKLEVNRARKAESGAKADSEHYLGYADGYMEANERLRGEKQAKDDRILKLEEELQAVQDKLARAEEKGAFIDEAKLFLASYHRKYGGLDQDDLIKL